MSKSRETRPYRSPLRQERAQATRQYILEAARQLFAAHGYVATTLAAIAGEAGVAPATVTAIFGTKLALVDALIKWTVRGDESQEPLSARPWWLEMLDESDPRSRLKLYAANVRRIHQRTTDLFEIVRSAAAAEPELATLRHKLGESHYQDDRKMAESLVQRGALQADMRVEYATDLLWALGSADLYRILVINRSWSPEQYEQWLAAAWIHDLLGQRDTG